MDNSQLILELKNAVLAERKTTTKVLHLLRQVESRRLYAERGYSSLFSFAVEFLGYSESAAHRRISAMRAIKELPQIETKILSGELSLTNIAQAQTFFKQEAKINKPVIKEEKIQLYKTLENKSARECEKILLTKSPEFLPQEKRRELTENKTEMKVVLNEELITQLDRLKQLWSHKKPNMSDAELITEMAKFCLDKIDPLRKMRKVEIAGVVQTHANKTNPLPAPEVTKQEHLVCAKNEQSSKMLPRQDKIRSRYISMSVKEAVWKRDEGKCQFKDLLTGRVCDSRYLIQIDHKYPWSLGGGNDLNNLQLLCSTHNALRAAKTFKKSKMYFDSRHLET